MTISQTTDYHAERTAGIVRALDVLASVPQSLTSAAYAISVTPDRVTFQGGPGRLGALVDAIYATHDDTYGDAHKAWSRRLDGVLVTIIEDAS